MKKEMLDLYIFLFNFHWKNNKRNETAHTGYY